MLVYDIAEIEKLSKFMYDVKILYQLKGYRFRSFLDLCHIFFSKDETRAFEKTKAKIRAHLKSYIECHINPSDFEMRYLIPNSILSAHEYERERLIKRLFDRLCDEHVIRFYETFYPKLCCLHSLSKNLNLKFNFVGSKTGRLSFKSKTFNPYTLPKEKRSCIKARPGFKIYEFDFRSSQPRIAIFSTSDDSFKRRFVDLDDIYSVFPGDREKNKISFLRWMFGVNYISDEIFCPVAQPIKTLREQVFSDSLNNHGIIHNRFGRPLYFSDEPGNIVFQNFIASTEADALYEIIFKMNETLEGKKSRILFPFYDAIVCEISDDEKDVPSLLKNMIETNYMDHVFYCRFPVEIKYGDNFGEMCAA